MFFLAIGFFFYLILINNNKHTHQWLFNSPRLLFIFFLLCVCVCMFVRTFCVKRCFSMRYSLSIEPKVSGWLALTFIVDKQATAKEL